jgi:hypothetical protein
VELLQGLSTAFGESDLDGSKPQNLGDLIVLLERACAKRLVQPPELGSYCDSFSKFTESTRLIHQQQMTSARGALAEMWADQEQIYLDLVEALAEASSACAANSWSALAVQTADVVHFARELGGCLEEVQAWKDDNFRRCLKCGWAEGEVPACPDCEVTLLRPVTKKAGKQSSRELEGTEANLFEELKQVLSGEADLYCLAESLATLMDFYQSCADDLGPVEEDDEEAAQLTRPLEEVLDGLDILAAGLRERDAQCLTDGWHKFFVSLGELEELTQDSDEDDDLTAWVTSGDSISFHIDD